MAHGRGKGAFGWDNYDFSHLLRRDFRDDHGSDGWDETPYRKTGKDKKKFVRKGCPENNNGPHVYIWVDYDSEWLCGYEIKICCGCLKRAPHHRIRIK